MFSISKYLSKKLLIAMVACLVLACIINLSAYYYGPVVVHIEARSGNGNMEKKYKELQAQLSLKKIQTVSVVDTADNRIMLTFFVYNEMILEHCEELLHDMMHNKDYSWIDYYVVY